MIGISDCFQKFPLHYYAYRNASTKRSAQAVGRWRAGWKPVGPRPENAALGSQQPVHGAHAQASLRPDLTRSYDFPLIAVRDWRRAFGPSVPPPLDVCFSRQRSNLACAFELTITQRS